MKDKLILVWEFIEALLRQDPKLLILRTREVITIMMLIIIETFRDRFYMKSSISKRESFNKSNILNNNAANSGNMVANIYG